MTRGVDSEAIKATLAVGSVAFEPEVTKDQRQIWLEPAVVDRLTRLDTLDSDID